MAEKVEIKIVVDKQTGAITAAGQELGKLGEAADKAGESGKKAKGSFDDLAKSVAGVLSVGAVAAFFQQSIQAASDQEEAVNKLNNALANTGQLLPGASQELQKLAANLQETTKFSDDTVISAQSLLATFGLNVDQIKKATQSAADLSAVMGTDLQSSAALLARAFQGEETALARLGIKIADNIPASQRFDEILSEISKKMGGRAQADANTFAGRMAQLKNAFEDVQKEIGAAFIPQLEELGNNIRANMEFVRNFFAVIVFGAQSAAAGFQSAFTLMSTSLKVWGEGIGTAAGVVSLLFKGRFEEARKAGLDFTRSTSKNVSDMVGELEKSNAKIMESWDKTIGARIKGESIAQTRINTDIQNGAEQRRAISEREIRQAEEKAKALIKINNDQLTAELAQKNLTTEQRIQIINDSASNEAAIQQQLYDQKIINEEQFNERIAGINSERMNRIASEEAKNQEDSVAANEAWAAKINNINARIGEIGRGAFDAVANAVGQSFARALLSGESFSKSFTRLWNNIKEQVVAQIVAMMAKLIAFKILAASIGGPFGGVFKFANGGRIPGLKNIRKLAGGGRTNGPEVAVIGEGQDHETVVPDGQARGFALGVLAGQNSGSSGRSTSGGAGGGSGQVVVNFTGGVNITIQATDMGDPNVVRQLAIGLAQELQAETEEAIVMARRIVDLNGKNSERAV